MTTLSAPEQLLLELINRARMDPKAEADRLGIDLNQWNTTGTTLGTESRQVLAGNNALAGIAESHSVVMHTSAVLGTSKDPHNEAGDGTVDSRFKGINYPSGTWGHGENVWWWGGTDLNTTVTRIHNELFRDDPAFNRGSPIGHRLNILNDKFRELGTGVITGSVGGTPATIVTEDFGYHGTQWFLSGAVYNDTVISDDFYTLNEGVAGIAATVTNAGGTVGRDLTGSGGGWTVGMPGGTYTVTFSGGGLAAPVAATVAAGNRNAKVDLVNSNEIWANVNTTLGTGARELHLLGKDNVNGEGNGAANVIVGNTGHNVLTGAGGSDTIHGGDGADTVVFSGLRSQYRVTVLSSTSATLADMRSGSPDGTDTISNVEFVRFADGTVNFSDLRTTAIAVAGSVAISDVTVSEGNSGTKMATFTVTRSGGTAAFNVNYATSNNSATTADGDYVATSNILQFAANEMSKTISVTINGDTKVEGHETFGVVLSGATNGATISDAQGLGTITNDDNTSPPVPTGDIPGDTTTSRTLTVGQGASSVIDTAGDQDWFRVDLTAGVEYSVALDAAPGSNLDACVRLLHANGAQWILFDMFGRPDSMVITPPTSGTYYISAQGSGASTGAYTLSLAHPIYGTAGSNTLNGTALGEHIFGLGDTDSLSGFAGSDWLDGGAGNDTMRGGLGNDTYIVDSSGDVVIESAGEGNDLVRTTSSSFTLAANVEDLIYYGTGSFTGIGNDGPNVISGGNGADSLSGGNGKDTLIGGAGADTLNGGSEADTFRFRSATDSGRGNSDTIFGWNSSEGDKIDLTAIDANPGTPTNDSFTYIGSSAFTGVAGQLRFAEGGYISRGLLPGIWSPSSLQADLNGDRIVDFEISLADGVIYGRDGNPLWLLPVPSLSSTDILL